MELHSLPVDCYVGGTSEGMLWMVLKGCPQPRVQQPLLENSPVDGGTRLKAKPVINAYQLGEVAPHLEADSKFSRMGQKLH